MIKDIEVRGRRDNVEDKETEKITLRIQMRRKLTKAAMVVEKIKVIIDCGQEMTATSLSG